MNPIITPQHFIHCQCAECLTDIKVITLAEIEAEMMDEECTCRDAEEYSPFVFCCEMCMKYGHEDEISF